MSPEELKVIWQNSDLATKASTYDSRDTTILALCAEVERLQKAVAEARTREKAFYRHGFEDGVRCFAWSKDGQQFVGTTGKTLAMALEQLEELYNFAPPHEP